MKCLWELNLDYCGLMHVNATEMELSSADVKAAIDLDASVPLLLPVEGLKKLSQLK